MSADNPTICFCLNVKKNTIVEAVQNGARTVNDIRQATRACCGCQSCYADIEVLIDKYAPEESDASASTEATDTTMPQQDKPRDD